MLRQIGRDIWTIEPYGREALHEIERVDREVEPSLFEGGRS
jgi:hypothetical protein